MSWFLVGGAAIGAGVGSYSADNGGSKSDIWKGALIGGAGGYAAGPSGFGFIGGSSSATAASTSAASGGVSAFGAAAEQSLAGSGTSMLGTATQSTATGAAGSWLSTPLIPGLAASNPLMMGAAGLALMGGSSSTGSAFQDKIELSAEGTQLKSAYSAAAKDRYSKAASGNVQSRAAQDMGKLRTAEGTRSRQTSERINSAEAMVSNAASDSIGTGTAGGNLVKANIGDASESMAGKFAPTSTLNNYRKEELVNASSQIQNLANLDNQVSAFKYSTQLSNWQTNQQLQSQKGTALGGIASMAGGAQLQQAYMSRMGV